MRSIIDTNQNTTAFLGTLKAQGAETVIRYIRPYGGDGAVTRREALAIAAHGMRLGLVCEGRGDRLTSFSTAQGAHDAAVCAGFGPQVGMPADESATVWFTIDMDPSAAEVASHIVPYFRAVKHYAHRNYRVGVYGPGAACDEVVAAGAADAIWIGAARAWRGTRASIAAGRYTLLQFPPISSVMGRGSIDENIYNAAHGPLGDFVPFGVAPSVAPEAEAAPEPGSPKWIQGYLNGHGFAHPPLIVDGKIGDKTEDAIKLFQVAHHLDADGNAGHRTVAMMEAA